MGQKTLNELLYLQRYRIDNVWYTISPGGNLGTTDLQKINESNRRGLKHKAGIKTLKHAIIQFLNDTIRLSLKTN